MAQLATVVPTTIDEIATVATATDDFAAMVMESLLQQNLLDGHSPTSSATPLAATVPQWQHTMCTCLQNDIW